MTYRLNVDAFFFNAKTDYLPYYKPFTMTLDGEAKSVEILKQIAQANENFAYPQERLAFRINDKVVTGEESIEEIVGFLGTELQIDPVTSYRSNHCLVINDDDFMAHFEKLAPYATAEDKAYYESRYALHYASESTNFNRDYVGDALLVTAHKMIKEGSEHKDAILRVIDDEDALWSCEYENNMFSPEALESTIEELKQMLKAPTSKNLCEKIMHKCMQKRIQMPHFQTLQGRGIAYYQGQQPQRTQEEVDAKINAVGATPVHFSRTHKRYGGSLVTHNHTLAYKKAAALLLDALDSGADVLVCSEKEACNFFREHYAMIQKSAGRDIELEVITLEELDAHTANQEAA